MVASPVASLLQNRLHNFSVLGHERRWERTTLMRPKLSPNSLHFLTAPICSGDGVWNFISPPGRNNVNTPNINGQQSNLACQGKFSHKQHRLTQQGCIFHLLAQCILIWWEPGSRNNFFFRDNSEKKPGLFWVQLASASELNKLYLVTVKQWVAMIWAHPPGRRLSLW